MRAIGWSLLFVLACGEPPTTSKVGSTEAWPVDGFLRLVPDNAAVTVRMPRSRSDGASALLACLGRTDDATTLYELDGVDPERAAGLVAGTDGSWLQLLPAADKGRINAALRERAGRVAVREETDWVVIGTGGAPAPGEAEPLRTGDAALRVVHHPLLNAVAQAGDQLELGLTLLAGGIEASGRLLPGKASPTAEAIQRAGGAIEGHLDLLPAWLALRVESTIPTTAYATYLARRIAQHASLAEGDMRDNLERFLREAATGLDPRGGLAFGFDLTKSNQASFVAVGRVAEGPASPILAKMRRDRQSTFGGLVLDAREMKSKRLLGFYAWIPQATPSATGLPGTVLPLLQALVQEDEGVLVTYAEADGYAVVAAGPRADALARAVRKRIAGGAKQSAGSRQLAILQERNGGECILAAVVAGEQFTALVNSDADALRSMLGAAAGAVAPRLIAVAGFRAESRIDLAARVIYR
ncbi:MAG: hypothetical protein ACYS0F_02625 [Planctomycetota bacterium]|jgi:hypothetical protein